MKLALVISSLSYGGAQRVMALLANHWAQRGEEVFLITIDSYASDQYDVDRRVRRVALGMMNDPSGLFVGITRNCARLTALRSALKGTGAESVLSFEHRTNVLVLLASSFAGIRTVVSERSDPERDPLELYWRVLCRMTYPLAHELIVQTRALLPWARAMLLQRSRVRVIVNPLRDMSAFLRTRPRAEHPVVVAVGRLESQKGFEVLITAFAAIADEFPHWRMIIAGEGTQRRGLEALVENLGLGGRVDLPGWLTEPGEALQRAAIFVMPSRYEGFPNALLEAMACGLPVISTNTRGAVEIITDGHDGLLVEVGDASALADGMRRLIQDERLGSILALNALSVAGRYKLESIIGQWDAALTPGMLPRGEPAESDE